MKNKLFKVRIDKNIALKNIIFKNKINIIKSKLSKRENIILQMLLMGYSYPEIAKKMQLGLSAVSAIIRRKIKPAFLKNVKLNKLCSI